MVKTFQARRGVEFDQITTWDTEADEALSKLTFGQVSRPFVAEELDQYWSQEVTTRIQAVEQAIIDADLTEAQSAAEALLTEQIQLFVDFTVATNILATPGISSSDPENALGIWTPA